MAGCVALAFCCAFPLEQAGLNAWLPLMLAHVHQKAQQWGGLRCCVEAGTPDSPCARTAQALTLPPSPQILTHTLCVYNLQAGELRVRQPCFLIQPRPCDTYNLPICSPCTRYMCSIWCSTSPPPPLLATPGAQRGQGL